MITKWISQALRKQPFQPFDIHLSDGRVLHVPHPDFVAVAPRLAIYIHPDEEEVTWIEPGLIVSVDFPNGSQAMPPQQGQGPSESPEESE